MPAQTRANPGGRARGSAAPRPSGGTSRRIAAGTRTPRRRARRVPPAPPAGTDDRCCRTPRRRARRRAGTTRSARSSSSCRSSPSRPGRERSHSRAPSSSSPHTGMPLSRAQREDGRVLRDARAGDDERRAFQVRRVVPTGRDVDTELAQVRRARRAPPRDATRSPSTSAPSSDERLGGGGSRDARADHDHPPARESAGHPRPPRLMKST